jgi:hypothetical protein
MDIHDENNGLVFEGEKIVGPDDSAVNAYMHGYFSHLRDDLIDTLRGFDNTYTPHQFHITHLLQVLEAAQVAVDEHAPVQAFEK